MIICFSCKEPMNKQDGTAQIILNDEEKTIGQGELYICGSCETEIIVDFIVLPDVYWSETVGRFVRKGDM